MKNLINSLMKEETKFEIRPVVWKGRTLNDYDVSNNGIVYRYNNKLSTWKVNGRNYCRIVIDNHVYNYRIDYIVAYTFLGMYDDTIRLIHLDDNIANDNVNNLMWYRKSDVLNEYTKLTIIESDETIEEEWRPCYLEYNPDLKYEVSNFGLIRDAKTKELIPVHESHGYRVFYYIDARFAKQTRIKAVHRAVAEAFIDNPNNYELVNHLDGNKFNDFVLNLEWTNSSMNMEHTYLQNLNNKVKYTENQIRNVCELLSKRKIPHIQISFMTGVDRKTISDIYRGRRHQNISNEYQFDVKKWNPSMKEEVCRLIIDGKKGREIFNILNVPYDQSAISFYERMRRELKSAGKIA